MRSIRGATTVLDNTKDEIIISTKQLLQEILRVNQVEIEDIISIYFTATQDLTRAYPAIAARQLGIVNAGLMCMQELFIEGSMPKCIRVMLNVEIDKKQKDIKHIYLKEAKLLRPDLNKTN